MDEPHLQLRRLVVRNFRDIADLDLELPEDLQVLCLVGENGSGKSALLSILSHALCQLTHEFIPGFSDGPSSATLLEATFPKSEIGPRGQSYYVGARWSTTAGNLTHHSCVRYSDGRAGELTNQALQEIGQTDLPQTYVGWDRKPPASQDPIARSVLLFRPSNRFEWLVADRNSAAAAAPTGDNASPDVAPQWVDFLSDGPDAARRILPVRPQTGLRPLEALATSPTDRNDAWDLCKMWAGKVSTVLQVLLGGFPQLRPHEDGTLGIHGRCETLSMLSAGESDLLLTAGYIAAQQLYIESKFGERSADRWGASGWVFIDEVDSHLHPSWQDRVLPLLCQQFPNVRFVVTTHSPFVLRSLKEKAVVLRLPAGDSFQTDFAALGIQGLSELMFDVPPGWHPDIQSELRQLEFSAADPKRHDEAVGRYRDLAHRSPSLRSKCDSIVMTVGTAELFDELFGVETDKDSHVKPR